MVHSALGAFTAIAIILGCVGGATGAYKTASLHHLVGYELTIFIRYYPDTLNTTVTQFITSPTGEALVKAGKPVGPRQTRMNETSNMGKQAVFSFKNASLSDGGFYQLHMYGYEPKHLIDFSLLITGRFTCNDTMNHTAVLGDKVTYACTAKYQGLVTDDAIWSGVGVTKGTRTATSADKVPCENAKPNTCFVGKVTYSVTIPVTSDLNNTNRTFKVEGVECAFEHEFGYLTVICKPGMMGPNCDEPMKCQDNPCLHGGICSTNSTGIKCSCPAEYVGQYCELPVSCKDVGVDECKDNTICFDNNGESPFECVCPVGYAGTPCVLITPPTNTTMKTMSATSNTSTTNDSNAAAAAIDAASAAVTVADSGGDVNETGGIVFLGELKGNKSSLDVVEIVTMSSSVSFLPFLSLLLIPLVAAAIIAAVIIHKRKAGEDEDDDESDDLSSSSE